MRCYAHLLRKAAYVVYPKGRVKSLSCLPQLLLLLLLLLLLQLYARLEWLDDVLGELQQAAASRCILRSRRFPAIS
jgi:hypothetical protein